MGNIPNMEPKLVAVDEEGKQGDLSVLDNAGIAFDPTTMPLDLNLDQKRRTTALMLAIQAYDKLIIKDAEMYEAICREKGRDPDSPKIRPATINAMVDAAIQFDFFISGRFDVVQPPESARQAPEQTDGQAEAAETKKKTKPLPRRVPET